MSRVPISWPVPVPGVPVRAKDGSVLVQERPITPRQHPGVAIRTAPAVAESSRSEDLENWVVAWAERMCERLDGEASQPSSARNVLSARSAQQLKAKGKAMPKARSPEGAAAVQALVKLERVLQPFLQSSARSEGVAASPRQSAPGAMYGGKAPPVSTLARQTMPKAGVKVGSDTIPASMQKVLSGPGGKASARFTEVTEALGPRVHSECNLNRTQTALSAVMSSPRSNLMPDMLSRSSPSHMEAQALQPEDQRWTPAQEEALHAKLDRMQALLNQAQKHTAEQLKWLRADNQELERLRAEELAGEDYDDDNSSSSSSSEDEERTGG